MSNPLKFFARQQRVTDYPYNGKMVWGLKDNRGGFIPMPKELAIAEAILRNAAQEHLNGYD